MIPLAVLLLVAPPPDPDVRALVALLGSPTYAERERAQDALRRRATGWPDERWALYEGLDSPERGGPVAVRRS